MKQAELKELASKLWDLEQKCQQGQNISENMKKMGDLSENLSLPDILQLADYMEKFELQR